MTRQLPTQLCRFDDGRIHSGFVIWQHVYADYGIPTFPVKIIEEKNEKKPMVRGWTKVWPGLSAEWAQKFPFAPAFGLKLGPKKWHTDRQGKRLPPASGIAELDIDSWEERILADALSRHGYTPIIIRTASGKFKLWYRHNGERRLIKPWGPDLPIDVLGGGYTVAPPSFSPYLDYQQYEFIQGGLDDLDRLPVMQNLEPRLYRTANEPRHERAKKKTNSPASPLQGMREGDGRNNELYRAIGKRARQIYAGGGTRDQLFEYAMSHNQTCAEPMAAEEVNDLVGQVWRYTTEGRNNIDRHGAFMDDYEIDAMIDGDQDALMLLTILRRHNGPLAEFMIANSLHDSLHWRRKRLVAARNRLIELGYIRLVKQAWSNSAALYRWRGYYSVGAPK